MSQLELTVSRREAGSSNAARRLRRTGRIPAVLYGDGKEPVPIAVDAKQVERILHSEKGENSLFQLALEDTGQRRPAMIKGFQIDPVTEAMLHADFVRIDTERKVQVLVHVELVGVPYGVKTEGGRIDFPVREVEVSCLPMEIPATLVADVSELHVHQSIRAGDLQLPEGVELLADREMTLATVHAKVAEEPEPGAEEEAVVAEGEEKAPAEGGEDAPKEEKSE